jgi:hypothetical protein
VEWKNCAFALPGSSIFILKGESIYVWPIASAVSAHRMFTLIVLRANEISRINPTMIGVALRVGLGV